MKFEWTLLLLGMALGGLRLPGLAGQLAVYPWLGLFPGLALASWLMAGESRVVRITAGLCLSPVLSAVLAWCLIRGGLSFPVAATVVSMAGWLAFAAYLLRPAGAPAADRTEVPAAVTAWALGLAVLLVAVPALNPYLFVRGDSWIHGGIVMELMERGFPPEDPRMAGLGLNYVWFFNFFIGLLASIHGQDPFPFMALLNAATGFATVVWAGAVAGRIWKSPRAALAAAVLMTLGLNAGAFLLWPLGLVRAMTGEVTGLDEAARQWRGIEWDTARIIYSLRAPFAIMVSFLDKLLVGSALAFAYAQMLFFAWALVVWLDGRRRFALAWLAASAAAMVLIHSVVGLSVVPVALAVLGLAWLLKARWDWLPARGALAAAAGAALAGLLVTLPYLRSITSGWAPDAAGFEHRFLSPYPPMAWTLLTSCFVPLALAPRPVLAAWRQRLPLPAVVAGLTLAMLAFALVIRLPLHNSVKFVFEVFAPCVLLAAPAFADAAERLWRERRPLALAAALLFVVPAGLTVRGYLVDRTGMTRPELNPKPGEEALYFWIRNSTPRGAVFVDRGFRDLIAVRGRRRLFLGTDQPPELAAFPAGEMRRRQGVMTDLYGPFAHPESTVAGLRIPGRPVYVVYRPEDPAAVERPWERLMAAAPSSILAYHLDRYRVVLLPAGESP